jgi:hypothetical protein
VTPESREMQRLLPKQTQLQSKHRRAGPCRAKFLKRDMNPSDSDLATFTDRGVSGFNDVKILAGVELASGKIQFLHTQH